jgi:hypothetical protein
MLVVFKAGQLAFFVHGFANNEMDNIRNDELVARKKLASELLAFDDKTIARVVASGTLMEVMCDEKTIP